MKHSFQRQNWLPVGGLLGLLVSLSPLVGGITSGSDASSAAVLEVPGAGDDDRCEHFVMQWTSQAPHPAAGYQGVRGLERAVQAGEVGLAEVRRRRISGGWQLEQDIAFPFEDVRLMAVECLSPRSPRLVWRELTPGRGRTLFAEWTARSDQLKVFEWAQDGSLRESLDTRRGAVMPQYLLELVRAGDVTSGRFAVFDPLVGGFADWTLDLTYPRHAQWSTGTGDSSFGLRQAEFRRTDGSLAGCYRFEGQQLVEFQWQEGCMWLRRISAEQYAARYKAWGLADPEPEPSPAWQFAGVKEM